MILALSSVIAVTLVMPTYAQSTLKSPCPSVFMYDSSESKPGRWYGAVNLTTDFTLHSIWLNILLDRKADILGTWIGNVTTQDNIDYLITNTKLNVSPDSTIIVKVLVNYNQLNPVPMVQKIRINGREVCDASEHTQWYMNDSSNSETSTSVIPQDNSNKDEDSKNQFDTKEDLEEEDTILNKFPNSGSSNKQQDQCGKPVIMNTNALVVNGVPTQEGQWPWQIALYQTKIVDNAYTCGGTLVSHRHVITAAHCVTRKGSRRVVYKNTLTVYLGKHNLRTSVKGVQIQFVSNISLHPEYNAITFDHNVAILEMRNAVEFTDWVLPACLWPDNQVDLSNVVGKVGSVVGWGYDATDSLTEELNLVLMPVVSQTTCLRSYSAIFGKLTSDYTYCAGYRDGTSLCSGDGGGGMVFQIGDAWHLRGIVSLSLIRDNRCDTSHYVIFTDIAKILPWIRQIIE